MYRFETSLDERPLEAQRERPLPPEREKALQEEVERLLDGEALKAADARRAQTILQTLQENRPPEAKHERRVRASLSEMPFHHGDAEWVAKRYRVDLNRPLELSEVQDLERAIDRDLALAWGEGIGNERSLKSFFRRPFERNRLMRIEECLVEVSGLMMHHQNRARARG